MAWRVSSTIGTALYVIIAIGCGQEFDSRSIAKSNEALELVKYELIREEPDESKLVSAIALCDTAIAFDSTYYLAYSNKAQFLCKLKKYEAAIQTLEVVLSKRPLYAEGIVFSGMIHDKIGDTATANRKYVLAMDTYRKRLLTGKHSAVLEQINIAFLQLMLNKPDGVQELERVLKAHPDFSDAEMYRKLFAEFDRADFTRDNVK